jgi:AcrR family transcriptional regulator
MTSPAHRRRAARHQELPPDDMSSSRRGSSAGTKKPITVDAIVETALRIVEREGYEALTMRRVAAALRTGPASLYAHVVNKDDLDDLLVGRVCSEIDLPQANPRTWRRQVSTVCTQLRDQYLRYPGLSRAALAVVPTNLETLRVSECLLAALLAGGVDARTAAWTVDALLLYVNAFCLEAALTDRNGPDLRSRFAALPDSFPHTKTHAAEVTSGSAADRFAFTLDLMLDGLGADRG